MSSLKTIANLAAKVVIVDERESVHKILAGTLRQAGFGQSVVVADPDELQTYLNSDTADWIIATLHNDSITNTLQFMQHFYDNPAHSHIRLSLFLTREQMGCLPQAFEKGLLSWHMAEFSVRHIQKEIKDFFSVIEKFQYREAYVAAYYLRGHLKKQKAWDELMNLEQTMASTFYQDKENFLNLAEAQFLAGDIQGGRLTLSELELLPPELEHRVGEMEKNFLSFEQDEDVSFADRHNVNTAVIIDPDEGQARLIKEALDTMGMRSIWHFSDGEAAWEHLSHNEEPDLIIQEWQIPRVTGPFLIQRIRSHGFHNVPIIIASSLLDKKDAQLVKDMSVSQVLKKPLREKQLAMAIGWSLMQFRVPTEGKTIERKVIASLASRDYPTALALKKKFLAMPTPSLARKKYVEGAFFYHEGNYEQAVEVLMESIRQQEGDNVEVLALLSRALMRMGDYGNAIKLMERAAVLSPKNIERLCQLAEIKIEAGQMADAEADIRSAEALDSENEKVASTDAKLHFVAGDTERAKELLNSIVALEDFLGFSNNLAVSKVRLGETEEGIAIYKKLLKTLRPEYDEYKAVVNYNLGLALIRQGDNEMGSVYVKRAAEFGESRVYDRALSLCNRMQKAFKEGKNFRLVSGDHESETNSQEDKFAKGLDEFFEKTGRRDPMLSSIGLYQIYKTVSMSTFTRSLLNIPGKRRAS